MRSVAYRSLVVALTGLAACLAVGCDGTADPTSNDSNDPPGEVVQSSKPRNAAPHVSAADAARLASDNAAFAMDLYPGISEGDGNVFYSPYSISLALAMTYAGAKGETQTQMAEALHFSLPPSRLNPAFDAIDLALKTRGKGLPGKDGQPFTINVVDSIWGQKGLAFEAPFLDTLAEDYGTGLRVSDFEKAPDAARTRINEWVDGETADKIPDLLPKGSIDTSTRMVLVNAIYFNASWDAPFLPSTTRSQKFSLLDGSKVDADQMFSAQESYPYTEGDGYRAAEIAYVGGKNSMVVILPDAGKFAAIEAGLTGAFVQHVFSSLQERGVSLSLPKFTIKGATVSLKDQLTKLGMLDAFDAKKADFSAMLSPKKDRLFVDDVLHQAFISVDESGTEAAAATAVIDDDEDDPGDGKDFGVTRPFFFFLRDVPTNTVLFVGRVTNPT